MTRRRLIGFLTVTVLGLAGCATPKEYVQPTPTALQDPLPGQALVYLLRSPYDDEALTLQLNDSKVAELPPERYTAVQIVPGTYTLSTFSAGRWSAGKQTVPPFTFTVQADQRYFINLPAPERKMRQNLIILPGTAVPTQEMVETGAARKWELTTERDAQWFMFYAKPVLPEKGAL